MFLMPFINALLYLVNIAVYFVTIFALLRFMLQLANANFYNPVAQIVVRVTDPFIRPLRRFIPGLWGLDWSSIILALAAQFTLLLIVALLTGSAIVASLASIFVMSIANTINILINIYMIALFAMVVLSWLSLPLNPAISIIYEISNPLIAKFEKYGSSIMQGLDFSPMLALVFLTLNKIIVVDLLILFARSLQG